MTIDLETMLEPTLVLGLTMGGSNYVGPQVSCAPIPHLDPPPLVIPSCFCSRCCCFAMSLLPWPPFVVMLGPCLVAVR